MDKQLIVFRPLLPQLWDSGPGVVVSSGNRPVPGAAADAVCAARAWMPAPFPRQLLAEPAGAVRLGPRPPQDHPETRTQRPAHLGHTAR